MVTGELHGCKYQQVTGRATRLHARETAARHAHRRSSPLSAGARYRKRATSEAEIAALLDDLVVLVRLAHTDPAIGHLVGFDCTAVRIGSDFRSTSLFYSRDSTVTRVSNIVSKEFFATGLELRDGP